MMIAFCNKCGWTPPVTLKAYPKACFALILIAIYLCILPVGGTIGLRNSAYFFLVLLTFWSALRYSLSLRLPLFIPWLLYSVVALYSLTYAIDPIWSWGEIKKEIGYGILTLMLTASWVRNIPSLECLFRLLIISNLCQIMAVAFKCTVLDPFWQHPTAELGWLLSSDIGGFLYGGVGNLSTYIVTTLPLITAFTLFLSREKYIKRIALYILLALNIFTLFLTSNRMGIISLTGEILFATAFLLLKKGQITKNNIYTIAILLIISASLISAILISRPPAEDDRLTIWSTAINQITNNPFEGAGFGRTVLHRLEKNSRYEHSHNMVLNKGVQMGILGIGAFLLLLGMTLQSLWPRHALLHENQRMWGYALAATTMTIGIFLKNMTDDFFVSHTAFLYWALVGATLGALAGEKRR